MFSVFFSPSVIENPDFLELSHIKKIMCREIEVKKGHKTKISRMEVRNCILERLSFLQHQHFRESDV